MKGFVSCTKNIEHFGPFFNENMSLTGFIPNYDFDCYIVQNYGAFMGVVSLDSMDDLYKKKYVYYKDYIEAGYELTIGPAPYVASNHYHGLFCKNYLDLIIKYEPNKIKILKEALKIVNKHYEINIENNEIDDYLSSNLRNNFLLALDLDSSFYTGKLCNSVKIKEKALMLIDLFVNYNDENIIEHIRKINTSKDILNSTVNNIPLINILKINNNYFDELKKYINIKIDDCVKIEDIYEIINKFKSNEQKKYHI